MSNIVLKFTHHELDELYRALFLADEAIRKLDGRSRFSRSLKEAIAFGSFNYESLSNELAILKKCKHTWLTSEPTLMDDPDTTDLLDKALQKIKELIGQIKKVSATKVAIEHFENCDSFRSYGGGCKMGGSFPGQPGRCDCYKYWTYFEKKILEEKKGR